MPPRIVYIECKSGPSAGEARIGRVRFSKTGRTLYYRGWQLQSLKGGYKANYFDVETGDEFWVSGPKRRGGDTLYGGVIAIDDDAREEYWKVIRKQPDRVNESSVRCSGK